MNYFQKEAIEEIIKCVRKGSYTIQVNSGKGIFNSKCQYNAIQNVKDGNATGVVKCVCIAKDRSTVFVHFINRKGPKIYVDNTLGYRSKYYDYYIIEDIEEDDYDNIDKELDVHKEILIDLVSMPRIIKYIFDINKNLV